MDVILLAALIPLSGDSPSANDQGLVPSMVDEETGGYLLCNMELTVIDETLARLCVHRFNIFIDRSEF